MAIPAPLRIENALLSYITYIAQMLWPAHLAVFYPYPQSIEAWKAAAALMILLSLSLLAIRTRRTRPYVMVGWFWYPGTLVPVIGLLRVGNQSHADRYTYIPMVGLTLIIGWGTAEVIGSWPKTRTSFAIAASYPAPSGQRFRSHRQRTGRPVKHFSTMQLT